MISTKFSNCFYLVLGLMLSSACEMAIELDDPYPGNRLVINGLINPDSAVRVSITESRSVLDEDISHYFRDHHYWDEEKAPYYKPVRGATVKLYEEGVLVATLAEDTIDTYVSNYYPKANSEYRLEVEKKGFPTAIATTSIPKINAEILGLDFDVVNHRTQYVEGHNIEDEFYSFESNFYELLAHLSFLDKVGEDYYEVQLGNEGYRIEASWGDSAYFKIYGPYLYFYQLESEDIIYTPYSNTDYYTHRVFPDDLFQQKNKTIVFSIYVHDHSIKEIEYLYGEILYQNFHIQLRNLSYDYYSYFSSLALQIRSENNPFSEPVQIYSNVEGGYGIFAGYNAQVKKFPIPWQEW